MNLLIIGAPGTGKGTMSEKLVKDYDLCHISTGDMLRESVAEGTPVGLLAQEYMSAGRLVPDSVIHEIILERLGKPDLEKGFLMDGYPRTLAQAEDLDDILKQLDKKIDAVLNLNLDEEIIIERICGRRSCPNCKAIYHIKNMPPKQEGVCDVCGSELVSRKDDNVESLNVRLQAYHEQTSPVIDYYQNQDLVSDINADQEVDDCYSDIKKVIEAIND